MHDIPGGVRNTGDRIGNVPASDHVLARLTVSSKTRTVSPAESAIWVVFAYSFSRFNAGIPKSGKQEIDG